MRHYFLLSGFLCVLSLTVLTACFKDDATKVAGGDDYPNGLQALGKRMAKAVGDSADWNGFDSIPANGPGLNDKTEFPDSIPATLIAGVMQGSRSNPPLAKESGSDMEAAAKASGMNQGLHRDTVGFIDTTSRTVDTIGDFVRVVLFSSTDTLQQSDTTEFIPADPAIPGSLPGLSRVVGRLLYSDAVRFATFRFLDADGDGYLSPRAGATNLADLESTQGLAGGVVERSVKRIAAGKDLDFNGWGDNHLVANLFVRTRGQDTLDAYRFTDADGDSALMDFSRDTNLVDMMASRRMPAGGPLASVSRTIRIVSNSKDSAKNYPIRYSERRLLRDGSIVDVSIRSPAQDSSFRPGDDVVWTESTAHAAGDSVKLGTVSWKVRLAGSPRAYAGNTLIGFTFEEKRAAGISDFKCEFSGDAPIADGRWISSGDVTSSIVTAKGGILTFTGRADAAGFTGTVTGGGVPARTISFDRAGNPITKP